MRPTKASTSGLARAVAVATAGGTRIDQARAIPVSPSTFHAWLRCGRDDPGGPFGLLVRQLDVASVVARPAVPFRRPLPVPKKPPPGRPIPRLNSRSRQARAVTADLMAYQGGRCAICDNQMTPPHVDHDHTTGEIRCLLCRECNLGLGHFRENPESLRNAAAYLEAFRIDKTRLRSQA